MTKQLTKQTIGVGVAGTGFIGPAHIEGLRRNGIHVLGLAENTKEKAERKAAELGIPRLYGSLDEMLADPDIDVVHLATPNYLHYPHAKAALLAGKHVICEKPLAMNSIQSGELVQLAAQKNLVNAVNFNIRMYPLAQQARSMVQNGELGDVFVVQGSYLQDWLLFPTDWNWRLEPSLGGTLRAVGDIGSHWLDLLTFITGQHVEAVMADLSTFISTRQEPTGPVETFSTERSSDTVAREIATEDAATILLRFDGGARGVVTVSQISPGRKNSLQYEIDGSESAWAWDSEQPDQGWIGHRDAPNEILIRNPALLGPAGRAAAALPGGHVEGFFDTFCAHFRAVYADVAAGAASSSPGYPTFADGHDEMVVGDAIAQSAREGRWVAVDRSAAAAADPVPSAARR